MIVLVPDDFKLDKMGAWSACGETAWLPKEHHPTRNGARMFIANETGEHYLDVRCRSVFIRPMPTPHGEWDVTWYECTPDVPGAIPAWRVE